jgi:Phage tail tube protein
MTFQPPSMGFKSLLGMGPTSTIVEQYEFKSESLTTQRALVRNPGIRGNRSQVIERMRQGTATPSGSIVFEPTLPELRKFVPRILGAAESSQSGYYSYAISDSLPYFWTSIWRVAGLYTYSNCVVDSAVFKSSSGSPLELTLNIEALAEAVANPGTFQTGLSIDATAPMVHMDSTLTLNGAAVQCMEVELTIDNMLKKDRFVNSLTRTDLPPQGRVVTLKATVPYTSDTIALYDTGMTGVTADLIWSVGGAGDGSTGTDLHFLLQNVIFPANKSPHVPGHDEITLTLSGQVYMTGGNNEISAKIDTTA